MKGSPRTCIYVHAITRSKLKHNNASMCIFKHMSIVSTCMCVCVCVYFCGAYIICIWLPDNWNIERYTFNIFFFFNKICYWLDICVLREFCIIIVERYTYIYTRIYICKCFEICQQLFCNYLSISIHSFELQPRSCLLLRQISIEITFAHLNTHTCIHIFIQN